MIVVDFQVPFLLRVGDPEDEEFTTFSVPMDGYSADLGLRMRVGGGKGGIRTAGGADEDRLGHMSTTEVRVVLREDFLNNIPDEIRSLPDSMVFQMSSGGHGKYSYIARESTKCVNKFIEIYKSKTESYWMRSLLPHDIFDFMITEVSEGGDENEVHHKHTASVMEGMASTISDSTESEIKEALKSNSKINIFRRLQLQIRDEISLGEHDLAVVDSQRLMEYWFKMAFEELLQEINGLSESDAMETARHNDGSFKDFHDIRKMFNSKLGFDIESTPEYKRWHDVARAVRNDVVHEGYSPSKEEAAEVANICIDLVTCVESVFREDLSENLLALSEMPDDGIGRNTFDGPERNS